MPQSPAFTFKDEQLEDLKASIQAYFLDELETDISGLQTNLFIDFLNKEVGKHYYNLGVADTITAVKEKANDLVLLMKD